MGTTRPWVENPEVIRLDDDGFEVVKRGKQEFRVAWSAVSGIAAFKRDLFTIDEICLGFRDSTANEYWAVGEEAENYDALVHEVERRYPCAPDWSIRVMFPAFATCWTVVWGDAPEPAECPVCSADISGSQADRCPKCGATTATRSCPECRGRGASYEWWWKWLASAGGIAGAALIALPNAVSSFMVARDPRAWGIGLLVLAAVCAVFAIRARPLPCTRCEGTGWWDPRGRALRQVPPRR